MPAIVGTNHWTGEEEEEFLALWKTGATNAEIAVRFGRSTRAIKQKRRQLNLPPRVSLPISSADEIQDDDLPDYRGAGDLREPGIPRRTISSVGDARLRQAALEIDLARERRRAATQRSALRVHARDGNLKWVSLLLWAGADPRLRVPTRNDCEPGTETEEDEGTALEDAVIYGQAEVLKKFKVHPTRDDVSALLCQCWLAPHPEIARMLLELGADVDARVDDRIPIEAAIGALSFGLDSIFRYSSYSENRRTNALACIEVLAQAGARWNPADPRIISSFRRALGQADRSEAIRVLKRLVEAKALEEGIFRELMRTPKMRALLDSGWVGDTAALKRYAGFVNKTGKSIQRRRQGQ